MRKLTVTVLSSALLLGGIGAGSALAAGGNPQHSTRAAPAASIDRASRDRHRERSTADRQSRDRHSRERTHQRTDRAGRDFEATRH